MNRLLCFMAFLLISSCSYSQMGYLFVKKGFKKKRIYTEGDSISFRLKDRTYQSGYITLLRNDTIFLNGRPIPRMEVSGVLLARKAKKPFPDPKTMLLIGGGAALTTAGLTLSKQAKLGEALTAALVIGYGPLLIRHFGSRLLRIIPRRQFRIGKKFRLQVLDFHLPNTRLKSF